MVSLDQNILNLFMQKQSIP